MQLSSLDWQELIVIKIIVMIYFEYFEILNKFLALKALDSAGNETVPTAIPAIAKLI